MKRVRLQEVAQVAGVSLGLASAVLNGRHVRARPETVERIREAAQRLGYVPDRMAQAMRWGRTGIIALVVPNFANPYYSALAVEVQRAAWEADLEGLVYATPTEDLAQVSRAVSARRVDGGIIVVSHYTPEELKAHLPLEIPWVGVGHALEPLPFDRVSFKDKEAAMDAVRYLADKGYRRIAHLAGPAPSPTAKARLEGYLEAVSALGMPALVQEGTFRYGDNQRALQTLLGWRADALLAGNDLMALEALAFLQDRGVPVPQGMAVVGFDGIPMGEWVRPQLTTIVRSPRASAQAALARLLARLEGAGEPPQEVWLDTSLRPGDSA